MVSSRNSIMSAEGAPRSRVVRQIDRATEVLTCRARFRRHRRIQESVSAVWLVGTWSGVGVVVSCVGRLSGVVRPHVRRSVGCWLPRRGLGRLRAQAMAGRGKPRPQAEGVAGRRRRAFPIAFFDPISHKGARAVGVAIGGSDNDSADDAKGMGAAQLLQSERELLFLSCPVAVPESGCAASVTADADTALAANLVAAAAGFTDGDVAILRRLQVRIGSCPQVACALACRRSMCCAGAPPLGGLRELSCDRRCMPYPSCVSCRPACRPHATPARRPA
jgi:hypothetical protein